MPISSSEADPQTARRVLQVDNGTLLDIGLSGLLRREVGVEDWTIPYHDDVNFRRDVEHVRPDVILLNKAGPPSYKQVLKALTGVPAQSTVRIIVVSLDTNVVDVHDLREGQEVAWKGVIIERSDDLAALIRGDEPV